jgi:hypothetical protein
MKGKSLARWESRRKDGFVRFVLKWGVFRFGGLLLVCSALSIPLAFWIDRRKMAQAGIDFRVTLADVVPFLPRLFLIVAVGGALLGVIVWFSNERLYRRAQREARA